jgi:hypothetical protein
MKETASRLLVSQHASRVASFHKAPSLQLYKKLVNESPDLKATLLEATRNAIFPSSSSARPTITYSAAAEIFSISLQTEDLVRLLNELPQDSSYSVGRAGQTIVKYLSKQSAPTHHKTALDTIMRGLNRAIENVLDEVYQAFPEFDEAYDWLEEKIRDERLTYKVPWSAKNYATMTPAERQLEIQRDKYLDSFVKRAARGSDEYGYGGGVDFYDTLDPNDSDYEEKMGTRTDLVGAIVGWAALLQEWPDKDQATKVWDQVKQTDTDSSLVFTVDGLAEALASR